MKDLARNILTILEKLKQQDILLILLILLGGWLLTRMVDRLFPAIDSRLPGRFRLNLLPWAPVFRLMIIIAAVIMIAMKITQPGGDLLVFLGAAGLAVGFALKEFVNSIIAGVIAIYERPYRPGDWVEIDGVYGEVQSMDLRTVKIVTPDDTLVSIPHKKIWDNSTFNASAGNRDLQCTVDFYLDPSHDPLPVRLKLHDTALSSSFINLNRPIAIIMQEKPWYSHYQIKAYPIDSRDQFQFITDLSMRGKAGLLKAGVKPAAPYAPSFQNNP